MSAFYCQECGKKFSTVKAAEKAASIGCPKCGGCDIDEGKPTVGRGGALMGVTCIDCGCLLARGEASPCLSCATESNRAAEAAGGGERACKDCRNVWSVAWDDDDNVADDTDTTCPDCGSDAIEPLSVAQHRAALAMDGGW